MIDLKSGRKLLSLVTDLFLKTGTDPSQIPYIPQKTASFYGVYSDRYFPRATPEECGLPSETLTAFLHELESDPVVNVHTAMVMIGGRVICDVSQGAYRSDRVHLSHSMCKSLVGLAYGCLIDEGKLSLDDRLADFFPEYKKEISGKMKPATIRDLLKMGLAVGFNEKDSLITENWTEAYLSEAPKEAPGSVFAYNSMTSFMLSSVLQRVTGETLFSYLESRLFAPLHIQNVFWEENPEGVTKAGWGLYISPEDMLKLGLLILDGGIFEGRRLIPEDYLRDMTSVQNEAPARFGDYNYGYQIWVNRENGNILFNGMLGQDILIIPKSRTVVVFTAGNGELFQHSRMLAIGERYFADREPAPALAPNKKAYRSYLAACESFYRCRDFHRFLTEEKGLRRLLLRLRGKSVRPLPYAAYTLDGLTLDLEPSNHGTLPFMVSAMQNSFSPGIASLSFRVEGDELYLTVVEGEESHKLRVGLYAPAENDLDIRGERYILALSGFFTQNEDGIPLLKLTLSFPELPCEKRWKLYYAGHDITLLSTELPGYAVVDPFLQKLEESKSGLLSLLMTVLPYKTLKNRIRASFTPVLHGRRRDGGALAAPQAPVAEEALPAPLVPEEETPAG